MFPNSVLFYCDPGFILSGSSERFCQPNGTWSGFTTLCTGMFRIYLASQSSVRKKMAAVHLTTIPCEPNTANMAHRKLCFCEILPRTNNIVHARFQVFKVFL